MKQKSNIKEIDTMQSYYLADKTTDDPFIRIMGLHSLVYCKRLFYLEEVEKILRANANVYAGRRLHENLNKGSKCYSIELASENLGIKGKVDYARRDSGEIIVCEHKKGKSKQGKYAWETDRIQIIAYALLLSEHMEEKVKQAKVHYHADNCIIDIPIDWHTCEKEIKDLVAEAKRISSLLERPAITEKEFLCRKCSLAPVCLPEEERFASSKTRKPQRLFPENKDRRIVHIVEQGSSIHKSGEQLTIYAPNDSKKFLPSQMICGLTLHGNIQISTQAIHFCIANNIAIHWLSYGGFYVGGINPGAGKVQKKNRLYMATHNYKLNRNLTGGL